MRALVIPGSGESLGFASLEKIENGILVHYMVAGRHRAKVPAHLLGAPMPSFSGSEEKIVENWFVTKKTIHCVDPEAVFKAIEKAITAKADIDRLEAEGKFASSQIENA